MTTRIMKKSPAALLLGFFLATGTACEQQPGSRAAGEEGGGGARVDAEGWQALGPENWRGFRRDRLPEAWVVEDGVLHFRSEGEGGDIVTKEQYENFELELEWKISEGGNSGIMFRVSEDHDTPWRTGPEFQVLDDAGHPDALNGADRLAGANYDMHAPSKSVVKAAGEWNQTRIVANGQHIEHWLNGEKIVEYELESDAWKQRIAESKWIDMPNYGKEKSGHISLQDHGDPVWYRNIRIRRLPGPDASSR